MTMMSNAGKFPTTNSKIHQRNPSWKSILPKHAKSQTYSAHSEPFRRFRKLWLRRFFVGFQKFGKLSTFYSILLHFSINNIQMCGLSEILMDSFLLKPIFMLSRLGLSGCSILFVVISYDTISHILHVFSQLPFAKICKNFLWWEFLWWGCRRAQRDT